MTGTNEKNRGSVEDDDDPTFDHDGHWRQATQRRYEPDSDGGLTTAIVFAIADADGVSPSEVKSPPLYETCDVAGIESALFSTTTNGNGRQGTGTVAFRYAEYLVKVRSDGWIQIYESTGTGQG